MKKNLFQKLVNIHLLSIFIILLIIRANPAASQPGTLPLNPPTSLAVSQQAQTTADQQGKRQSLPAASQEWTLQQCIDTALVYNRTLAVSKNQADISEQRVKEMKAGYLPAVQLSADYKYYADLPYQYMPMSAFGGPENQFRETQFGVPHNIGINAQLTMPLFHPQLSGAVKSSAIASDMARLAHIKTGEEVSFDISLLYYNAQILIHQLSFIDSNLVNTRRLLENLRLLHTQQMIKGTDVKKVELQAEQLSVTREQGANSLDQVMKSLKFNMGIALDAPLQINSEISYQAAGTYPNHPSVDIQLAETRLKMVNSELKTIQNTRLPSVSFMASYGQTGFGYDKKPDDFLTFHPVSFAGLKISYPLFNGTVTKRKIVQKQMEISSSELQLDIAEEQNLLRHDIARNQMAVARRAAESLLSQVHLAQEVYEDLILQQREGTANLTEVLMADNAWREAHQKYLSSVIDYLKSEMEFKKITGNLLSTNLSQKP